MRCLDLGSSISAWEAGLASSIVSIIVVAKPESRKVRVHFYSILSITPFLQPLWCHVSRSLDRLCERIPWRLCVPDHKQRMRYLRPTT